MIDDSSLFPFPGSEDDDEKIVRPDLPEFPEPEHAQEKLSPEEISLVRVLLKRFFKEDEPDQTKAVPVESQGVVQQNNEKDTLKEQILAFFDKIEADKSEENAKTSFKLCLNQISDNKILLKAFAAINGIFPVKRCIRHGAPEQKLFALIAMGDRFLQSLSGEVFSARKKLLKTAATYLSSVSDQCNFIQMENENFSMQYHERAAGSSNTGRVIREMTGFLVVEKSTNRVVRIGQVLT